jgi:hypothetical protein
MQVEEVLDPAIAVSEDHQGFELLGDDCLTRVGEHLGCGKVEQRRIRARLRGGPHRIAKPQVELQHEARRAAAGRQRHPCTGVLVLGTDRLNADRLGVEDDGVGGHLGRAYDLEVGANRLEGTAPSAQKVEVARGAVGLVRPHAKQHGALEHEALPENGNSQAVEEALEAEVGEEGLVVFTGPLGVTEQPRGNGGREVALAAGHAMASR